MNENKITPKSTRVFNNFGLMYISYFLWYAILHFSKSSQTLVDCKQAELFIFLFASFMPLDQLSTYSYYNYCHIVHLEE